jgi:hypothetical protein
LGPGDLDFRGLGRDGESKDEQDRDGPIHMAGCYQ